ncbi:MAG: hypothetical protein V3U86_06495 [Acidobacteriota bacterium]
MPARDLETVSLLKRPRMMSALVLPLGLLSILLLGSRPLPEQVKSISYLLEDASQLDAELPAIPFRAWLKSVVGEGARIDWNLTECGDHGFRGRKDHPVPQCLGIDVGLPECGRLQLSIVAGKAATGIHPRLTQARGFIEGVGPTVTVRSLHELPARMAEARNQMAWLQEVPPATIDVASAINRVKRLKASDLDGKLDRTTFSAWFRRLAGTAEKVTWKVDRCDPMARRRGLEGCADEWACVHARFENDLDSVSVAVVVGTYRRGLFGSPQIYSTRHFVKTGQNFGIRQSPLHEILSEFEQQPLD